MNNAPYDRIQILLVTVDDTPETQVYAIKANTVIGRVGVQVKEGRAAASIRQLYVDPIHRDKGIGSALLNVCSEIAHKAGASVINLVCEDEKLQKGFYDPIGFHVVAQYDDGSTILARRLPWPPPAPMTTPDEALLAAGLRMAQAISQSIALGFDKDALNQSRIAWNKAANDPARKTKAEPPKAMFGEPDAVMDAARFLSDTALRVGRDYDAIPSTMEAMNLFTAQVEEWDKKMGNRPFTPTKETNGLKIDPLTIGYVQNLEIKTKEQDETIAAMKRTIIDRDNTVAELTAQLATLQSQSLEAQQVQAIARDYDRLKKAGYFLSTAAADLVRTGDGTHRLSIAIAGWHQTLANEGGRGERHSPDFLRSVENAAAKITALTGHRVEPKDVMEFRRRVQKPDTTPNYQWNPSDLLKLDCPPGWRMLNDDELPEPGDEALTVDSDKWEPVEIPDMWNIGGMRNPTVYFRRKVQPDKFDTATEAPEPVTGEVIPVDTVEQRCHLFLPETGQPCTLAEGHAGACTASYGVIQQPREIVCAMKLDDGFRCMRPPGHPGHCLPRRANGEAARYEKLPDVPPLPTGPCNKPMSVPGFRCIHPMGHSGPCQGGPADASTPVVDPASINNPARHLTTRCTRPVPVPGYFCTRLDGHAGPCAAARLLTD